MSYDDMMCKKDVFLKSSKKITIVLKRLKLTFYDTYEEYLQILKSVDNYAALKF